MTILAILGGYFGYFLNKILAESQLFYPGGDKHFGISKLSLQNFQVLTPILPTVFLYMIFK